MIEVIEEQSKIGAGSSLHIQGPYTGTSLNKNGRVYPEDELNRDINRYLEEMVKTKRSLGELNHSQTAEVNPERACHMVTQLTENSGTWYGKSKILTGEGMTCGNLVKGLINNGVSLGISTMSFSAPIEFVKHGLTSPAAIIDPNAPAVSEVDFAFVN